jgi:hypothetical protein
LDLPIGTALVRAPLNLQTDTHGEHGEEAVRELAGAFRSVANHVAGGAPSAPAAPAFTVGIAAGLFSATAEWRHVYYAVLAAHPDSDARWVLACTGPLGILRALVHDPDPQVRYGILFNPYVVDADIQATLAGDPEPQIVVDLLRCISPSADTCRIVMDGPHVEARQTLARMRIGSDRLKALAQNDDLVTRCIARARLDARGELGAGGRQ